MAEIYTTSSMPVPVTPTKAGLNVSTTEVTPQTPAPQYSTTACLPKDGNIGINPPQLNPKHPTLPIGNVFIDIRNHLSCYSIFNANIETLLQAYMVMKTDLDCAQSQIAKLEREVKHERREKIVYKEEAQELRRALVESEANLDQTREELAITQDKLRLSVKQLMEITKRLEEVKNQLRKVSAQRDQLLAELEVKESELQYCKKRISELEYALALANKGENDANERNVRLTQLLYEIERQKAEIERARDMAEKRLREIECDWDHGSEKQKRMIVELRCIIQNLECDITKLTEERDEAKTGVEFRAQIIETLDAKLKAANKLRDDYRELLRKYDQTVKDLGCKSGRVAKPQFVTLFNNRHCYIGKEEAAAITKRMVTSKWSEYDMSMMENVEDGNDNDDSVAADAEQEVTISSEPAKEVLPESEETAEAESS